MSQWTMEDINRLNAKRGAKMPAHIPAKSKYRNVRTVIDGETFDSKREANYWAELTLREKAGEITNLRRQVPFDLLAPVLLEHPRSVVVSVYLADFVYTDLKAGHDRVVDAKGKRTQMYALKAKWLFLQSGIQIEEV